MAKEKPLRTKEGDGWETKHSKKKRRTQKRKRQQDSADTCAGNDDTDKTSVDVEVHALSVVYGSVNLTECKE